MTPSNNRLLTEFTPPTAEEWQAEAERSLKGKPLEKLATQTYEAITVQPIYSQADTSDVPYLDSLPGVTPYLRGTRMTAAAWQICQDAPYSSAEAVNQALRHDLERGQTAIQLVPDMATRRGVDPDEAPPGTVGHWGHSIATVDDMATMLAGIELERVPLFAGTTTLPLAALLLAALKKRDDSRKICTVTWIWTRWGCWWKRVNCSIPWLTAMI
jgi:methylmalonyl-CoA mutase